MIALLLILLAAVVVLGLLLASAVVANRELAGENRDLRARLHPAARRTVPQAPDATLEVELHDDTLAYLTGIWSEEATS